MATQVDGGDCRRIADFGYGVLEFRRCGGVRQDETITAILASKEVADRQVPRETS